MCVNFWKFPYWSTMSHLPCQSRCHRAIRTCLSRAANRHGSPKPKPSSMTRRRRSETPAQSVLRCERVWYGMCAWHTRCAPKHVLSVRYVQCMHGYDLRHMSARWVCKGCLDGAQSEITCMTCHGLCDLRSQETDERPDLLRYLDHCNICHAIARSHARHLSPLCFGCDFSFFNKRMP